LTARVICVFAINSRDATITFKSHADFFLDVQHRLFIFTQFLDILNTIYLVTHNV
jgi:hypothetical protein